MSVVLGRAMSAYQTLLVDPPWPYKTPYLRNKGGRHGNGTNRVETATLSYPTLTLEQMRALPVGDFAADHAWLWLWTTDRFLPESFSVAAAWGFDYRQTFIWHKSDGHPRFPATIAPIRSEYLLVCRSGKPKRTGTVASNVQSIPFNPARMKHSQKPEAFYDLIESVCGGPYLELFARRRRLGWDAWGNEVDSDVELVTRA